jgi:hypothetical protein
VASLALPTLFSSLLFGSVFGSFAFLSDRRNLSFSSNTNHVHWVGIRERGNVARKENHTTTR